LSDPRLMDHREAQAVRARFGASMLRWTAGSGVALLLSIVVLMGSIPVSGMLVDDPMAAMRFAMLGMMVGGGGAGASLLMLLLGLASRWNAQRAELAEAERVLATPVSADPAWTRLDAGIRGCLGRTDDPDLRAKLQQLHAMLEREFRSAAGLEPGSEADHRFRDVVGQAQRAVTRLQDSLSGSSADARDLVAFLEARAEVESPLKRETSVSSAGRPRPGVRDADNA
jgi:hypothetical protein